MHSPTRPPRTGPDFQLDPERANEWQRIWAMFKAESPIWPKGAAEVAAAMQARIQGESDAPDGDESPGPRSPSRKSTKTDRSAKSSRGLKSPKSPSKSPEGRRSARTSARESTALDVGRVSMGHK